MKTPRLPSSLLVILNPRARRVPDEWELRVAAAPLRDRGWTVDIESTAYRGDATRLARDAASAGMGVVVACGGDGTVREVANGLAGTETALGVIPAGTANVWAKEARLPRHAETAFQLLPRLRAVNVDTGVLNGEHFLLMCSVGFDAATVRDLDASRSKRYFGRYAFAAKGAIEAVTAEPVFVRTTVDGETLERELLMAVAGNTRLYGGVLQLTRRARMDDGLLDLVLFSGDDLGRKLALTARALRGQLERDASNGVEGVDYLRGAAIRIETESPMPVQADGEYVGETPVELSLARQSLRVLMAPQPNALLGET